MIFHRDAHGLPRDFRAPVGAFRLSPTRHAIERAAEKGFVIPSTINMCDFSVIEVTREGIKTVKLVIRGKYDEYDDIVIVIMFAFGKWIVKTAWLNAWNDTHSTLDKSKYGRP